MREETNTPPQPPVGEPLKKGLGNNGPPPPVAHEKTGSEDPDQGVEGRDRLKGNEHQGSGPGIPASGSVVP